MRHSGKPSLYSIPPAAPFLSTLVEALLFGNLVPGFKPADDPLALSGVTIYVPTRRAARALQAEFVARIDQKALLLPKILPLGDIEEEQFLFEPQTDKTLDLDPVIGNLERQLLLTRMIRQWTEALENSSTDLFEGERIVVPSSLSDAAWLANDLATLMDTVATEEASWAKLEGLVPDDHADWWKLTLTFLQIATNIWPELLRERGTMDMATRRGLLLHRQAKHYQSHGSPGPVIAAGSTGSIPATAALLKAIAHMENGAVVLPGLDRATRDDVWDGLDTKGTTDENNRCTHQQAAAPGHPQYGLKKLLENIGATRSDVEHIGGIDDTSIGYARIREEIVALAMEPSDSTDNWPEIRAEFRGDKLVRAFEDVSLVEAAGERQEALAIALAMREILNQPNKTAALITPDRVLARRVSVELKRFGVDVDDSAGLPLADTPQGSFVKLVLAVTLTASNPVNLLALIKHPLACFGLRREAVEKSLALLELAIVRGNIRPLVPGEYMSALQEVLDRPKGKSRLPTALQSLEEEDWQQMAELAQAMDMALAPLHHLFKDARVLSLGDMAKIMIVALEAVATDEEKGLDRLYEGDNGEALSSFLGDLLGCSFEDKDGIELTGAEWPVLYEALLGSRPVRQRQDFHPRLSIWGPLEARLQQVDRIILGGLNEGTWPASARNDPFLNRPMKASLLLEPPERRIGLAAHDFQMLLGTKDVIMTRSLKVDNAPTVASRWVQRLLTLSGEDAASSMARRGQKYLDWVNQIDRRLLQQQGKPATISQPEPKPPLDARPSKLRLTEIETWIRDPYAIYARYILNLLPLEPVTRQADARERGVLYHAIFEEFSRSWSGPFDEQANEHLMQIGREQFAKSQLPAEITAFWWPRFAEIAALFVEWENTRFEDVSQTMVELSAKAPVGKTGFTISCRADRIDVLNNGGHVIIDYKTGLGPSAKQANVLLAPQLPLEGALALRGAFEGVFASHIDALLYVRLRVAHPLKIDALGKSKDLPDPQELTHKSWTALEALVKAYQSPDRGYLSRARPFKQGDFSGDYDHLARVLEWSLGDDEAETS
jgi:ATP-dependent helicase/nuclease subunit B